MIPTCWLSFQGESCVIKEQNPDSALLCNRCESRPRLDCTVRCPALHPSLDFHLSSCYYMVDMRFPVSSHKPCAGTVWERVSTYYLMRSEVRRADSFSRSAPYWCQPKNLCLLRINSSTRGSVCSLLFWFGHTCIITALPQNQSTRTTSTTLALYIWLLVNTIRRQHYCALQDSAAATALSSELWETHDRGWYAYYLRKTARKRPHFACRKLCAVAARW